MLKAVLFDLDDTLILQEPVFHALYRQVAASARMGDDDRLARDAASAARRLWKAGPHHDYCQRIGHSATEGLVADYSVGDHPEIRGLAEWVPGFRAAVWQEALSAQGLREDGSLAPELARRFLEGRTQPPVFPGTEALLESLRGRYLLGIVTNGVPGLQRPKVEGSGLMHLFQAVAISGEVDIGKPDPRIFRHICAELGVEPAECVMVGDNPERDVAGGIAAGMKTVWVRRYGREREDRYPADFECGELHEMLDWLEGQ